MYSIIFFDVPDQEQHSSVKLGWIFLWFAIAGIIGGITPFIWRTNHGWLVSSLISALFIILTAKPLSKWLVNSQQ